MRSAFLIFLLFLPTGCEKAAANRSPAQLVAKVNGTEISLHQVRAPAYAGAGTAAANAGALDKLTLEKLIDRELLVQSALAAKLDRDPQVAQSIENARRQLLAQAYLERSVSAAASAATGSGRDDLRAAEVRSFYAENPALFAERRIYRLRELVVSAPAEMIPVLRAESAKARDLEEVAAWLKSRGANYHPASEMSGLTQPAEQLPLSYLPQLARMKAGEIAVFANPMGASVIQLVHAEDAPLSEAQAAPLIEQFLAGRRRLESAAAEVKRLREVANIEYLGEFKRGN
jgi:EpsD family peptidyl-prolyl cis-trans isomerase